MEPKVSRRNETFYDLNFRKMLYVKKSRILIGGTAKLSFHEV